MGCKNTKVYGTAGCRKLDELPTEILYKILDELDIATIFHSLHHVCKRFDEILDSYNQYHLDLRLLSLKQLALLSTRLRGEQITKLTLTSDEASPGLTKLFLEKFAVQEFVQLRALSIAQIKDEELLCQLLLPVADHTSLLEFSSISIVNDDEDYHNDFLELLMLILSKPSLRKVHLDLSYSRTTSTPLPWPDECAVREMTLIGTCTMSFLRSTFTHAPQLTTLITDDLEDFDEDQSSDSSLSSTEDDDDDDDQTEDHNHQPAENGDPEVVDIPLNGNANADDNHSLKKEKFPPLESVDHLTCLTLNSCTFTVSKLDWLLQNLPALKRFDLVTTPGYDDKTILDGSRWEKLIPHLDRFRFVFAVSLLDDSPWNAEACLRPYQKPFWTELKRWYVSMEKYDDCVLLYTLPYIHTTYVMRNESTPVEYLTTAKANSRHLLESMKHVKDLYIDTSETLRGPAKNLSLPRFTHVEQLILHGRWSSSDALLDNLPAVVELSSVRDLTRTERMRTSDTIVLLDLLPNLQAIRTTTSFLDALNAAKLHYPRLLREFSIDPDFSEDQRAVNVEPFCAMFPRIQNLNIPVDSVDSCKYVLEQLNADLVSVIFQIPTSEANDDSDDSDDDDDDDDETNASLVPYCEWMKDLPGDYQSCRIEQHIHIALK